MQDDFDRNDPADEQAEDELPLGMHIVEEDEKIQDEESPLNLNEEYEEKAPDEL